jgi:hypothetical protein
MSSNTVIQLKKSGTTGNSPSSLNYGELALNWADGKLWYKNDTGIKAIYNQKTFSTINSNNTLILAGSYADTLSIVPGKNITIDTDAVHNEITINTSVSPTFSSITSNNSINIGTTNIVSITSNTLTTLSTSQVTVDSFDISIYRSAKYFVQMISGTNYHIIELNVIHDGTNTSMAQYGEVILGTSLGSFQTSINTGILQLLFTPKNTVTVVKLVRTTLMV